MTSVSKNELIQQAASLVKTKKTKNGLFADVACVLLAKSGKVYKGVCADAGSNVFCAETIAIGSMITDGSYKIKQIVAVWKNEKGEVHVVAPCGNCRQLMLDVDKGNLTADVILDKNKVKKLKELLPHSEWYKKQKTQ